MPCASSLSKAKDDNRKLLVVLLQSTSSTSGRKASDALCPLVFETRREGLQLPAETCNGEAQLLSVLSHRTASDGIASLGEKLGKLLIGEWLTLIFLSNQLCQGFTYLTCGDALAFLIEDPF